MRRNACCDMVAANAELLVGIQRRRNAAARIDDFDVLTGLRQVADFATEANSDMITEAYVAFLM